MTNLQKQLIDKTEVFKLYLSRQNW